MILVLQSKLYVLSALGWLGMLLVIIKCFVSQVILILFIEDILRLKKLKITNIHLFSLKTDILLDKLEERDNKKLALFRLNKKKVHSYRVASKKFKYNRYEPKKGIAEKNEHRSDIDFFYNETHRWLIEGGNSPKTKSPK